MQMTVFCGPPGSGKTTLSKKIAEEHNIVRYSFDEMGCLQHKELIPHVADSLRNGRSTVVDALYTRASWRRAILEATEHIACKRVLVYMDTSLEECICRNRGRGNPLPDFMVTSIYQSFESPTSDEGWDEIVEVKTYESNITGD